MRITDQYLWNFVFTVVFLAFIFMGVVILESEAYKPYDTLTLTDFALMALATFRLIRLVIYDKVSAFFREQFYDVQESKTKVVLVKPTRGPRRTILDLIMCPWCLGLWASATVIFFYLLTPYAYFPVLLMALGGVATFLQLLSNMIGWKAEGLKQNVEGR